MKSVTFFLAGIVLLTLLTILASCSVIDTTALPHTPIVKMGANNFLQPEVDIKKGQKIDLVNTANDQHVLANGQWQGSKQVKTTTPGAPSVNLTVQGNQTSTIGPFNTAGTFHIYCTIHQGMDLVVKVS
ncbi:hypothetical protein KDH_00620 [Dictyobacter sp. S3.2.2.5]|uniref:Blue (type 1) copper domain-containing protein n=1 Tax=Dictyobacter halimunensis TaxID=3026934 RepID=A0ABQ6FGW8_9CHLR|nr:hypothetical protein KDH_00620 [Dictyobacter sp. S3.2.2.5]